MPPINWIGVLVAWIVGWLVHGIWYMVFGAPWMRALGWTAADMASPDGRRRMPAGPMFASLIAELLMALMLAGIVGHLGGPTVTIGAVSGALVWLGFVVTTIAVNNAFQKRSLTLTVIDSGAWLAVLVVQGIMLGLFA
jgi:Protein of unknown function (DUF1761)